MPNVLIDKDKLDVLANAISAKSGESVTMTLDEMVSAVDSIPEGGGGITPTGNINIAQAGVTDVTNYATATVPSASVNTEILPSNPYHEITVDSDGVVSAAYADYEDFSVIASAGWIGTNASVHTNIYDSFTYQLPTQAATTITPTTSAQTAVAAGKYTTGAVTVAAMPSGSATPAATITGTSATVVPGTNNLTLSKTVSNTPQVSAGYISAGTAGNTTVSLTANITTKSSATIHPSSSNQTIAGGTYLTGTQTINAVTTTNLTADNIKSGVVVQVGDSSDSDCVTSVTGTYSGGSNPVKTKTGTFTGNGTRTIDVTCDFEPDLVYVTSDPGTTASSGTVAFIIARDMMTATRYRNNSTTNSHYAVTPCVNLNTSGSSYSWRATYADSKVTLYCFSNNARTVLTNGRTYTYQFVKWTT